ncbi:hypothetical protein FRC12_019314 [Ceratobasidium sp. 428]|nr:hypothetical protein FRC12_019314 [Ceratobasidium sp. 428]
MSPHRELSDLQPSRSSMNCVWLARGAAADIWKYDSFDGWTPIQGQFKALLQRIRKDIRVNQKCLVLDSLDSTPDPQSFHDLWSEFQEEYRAKVEKWSSLCHPNVIRVFGFVDDSLTLEVDYCAYGCVRDYLKSPPQPVDKAAMIIDVIAGLRYLHEYDPPIVHGNINAGKLFVIHSRKTVVGEFGLAALCYPFAAHVPSISYTGFSRWLSPELLGYDADDIAQPTLASDIWALGCTLFEILTETLPYSKQKRDIQVQRQILSRQPPGYCGDELRASPLGVFWPIVESCWTFTPANRPTVLALAGEICRRAPLNPDIISNVSRQLNIVTNLVSEATVDTVFGSSSHSQFPLTLFHVMVSMDIIAKER